MNIKLSYFVVPLVTLFVMVLGGIFTNMGMEWYRTLVLPAITPPDFVFSIAWTIIFIAATSSFLMLWNSERPDGIFYGIVTLFIINAAANLFWSYIFFVNQSIIGGFADAIILELTVLALIILILPRHIYAALLLLPYAAWVMFAIYLNYLILQLN